MACTATVFAVFKSVVRDIGKYFVDAYLFSASENCICQVLPKYEREPSLQLIFFAIEFDGGVDAYHVIAATSQPIDLSGVSVAYRY